MIKRIIIKNFQKHRSLKLKLDPHITTIIGPSDVGKSAIIRAIRWVVFNRPGGSAFVNDDASFASVILRLGKQRIKRTKGKKNTYHLNGSKMVAFGSGVPDEVQDVLKLSEINFQQQHDSSFWFAETAGEVSRQLNQIVNLEVMDSTLSNLAGMLRKVRAESDVISERIEDAQEDCEKSQHAQDMNLSLMKVEGLEKIHLVLSDREERLSSLFEKAWNSKINMVDLNHIAAQGEEVVSKGEFWKAKRAQRVALETLVEEGRSLQAKAKKAPPAPSEAAREATKWQALVSKREALEELIQDAQEAKETSCQKSKESRSAGKKMKRMMGETCPLCEQKIQS